MDLSKLGSSDIASNLGKYVQSFSRDAREIDVRGWAPPESKKENAVA